MANVLYRPIPYEAGADHAGSLGAWGRTPPPSSTKKALNKLRLIPNVD